MSTDEEWEKWGEKDPYFGVLTDEKFRSKNIDDAAKGEFFESGKKHVQHVLEYCQTLHGGEFIPKRVLDFGCGVGRLVIPFAEIAEEVVGLDVSASMLKEAEANCQKYGLENTTLLPSDDTLSKLPGSFDLIHTYIVMQHIPTARGRNIFTNLLSRLNPGGIGALQVTYAKEIFKDNYGLPPESRSENISKSAKRPFKSFLRKISGSKKTPKVVKDVVESVSRDPEMQMNPYNLNQLFYLLQSEGIKNIHVELTDHGGELGTFLYFQKPD